MKELQISFLSIKQRVDSFQSLYIIMHKGKQLLSDCFQPICIRAEFYLNFRGKCIDWVLSGLSFKEHNCKRKLQDWTIYLPMKHLKISLLRCPYKYRIKCQELTPRITFKIQRASSSCRDSPAFKYKLHFPRIKQSG